MELFLGATGALLAALFLTSFIKILTALNIMRYGLGLTDAVFGLIIIGVSVGLTTFVMSPQIESAGGVDALLRSGSVGIERTYRPFLEAHTDKKILDRLISLRAQQSARAGAGQAAAPLQGATTASEVVAASDGATTAKSGVGMPAAPTSGAVPFAVLASAFMLSELSAAFAIGVLLLVPFVVIDLAVANLLMALGASQISQQVISLPLKILLFVVVDGWGMVSGKLLNSYL